MFPTMVQALYSLSAGLHNYIIGTEDITRTELHIKKVLMFKNIQYYQALALPGKICDTREVM